MKSIVLRGPGIWIVPAKEILTETEEGFTCHASELNQTRSKEVEAAKRY